MPAYSDHAEEANLPGYGPLGEQMAGLTWLQGYEGGPPQKSGIAYGDPVAAAAAVFGTLLGLHKRLSTGRGCDVTVPQRDVLIHMVAERLIAEELGIQYLARAGNRDERCVPHDVYRAADDVGRMRSDGFGGTAGEMHETWIAIAVDSDATWSALVQVIGDPRLRDATLRSVEGRQAQRESINEAISAWARRHPAADGAALLQASGVAASPVLTPLMLTRDPHLAARGFYEECDHPVAGRHRCTGPTSRFAMHALSAARAAPCFGQHTHEILGGVVCSADEIRTLEELSVITDKPLTLG
jgi:crotonobetainyl-CoA:carnitine CoA-transferase CaiB-like acyl-CoA transferase